MMNDKEIGMMFEDATASSLNGVTGGITNED
jgi:hypothetical protein